MRKGTRGGSEGVRGREKGADVIGMGGNKGDAGARSGASSSGIDRPTSLAGSNATSTGDSDVQVTPPSRVFSMYPLAVLRPTDPTPAYATSGLPADTL